MGKFSANILKELLLLFRDYTGLLIIFLMPIALVIVITLVQQNIMGSVGKTKIKAVFLDNDRQMVGTKLRKELSTSDIIDLIDELDENPTDIEAVRMAVAEGRYQAAIVIPAGATKAFIQKAKQSAQNSLSSKGGQGASSTRQKTTAPEIQVYFDPTIVESVRAGIVGSFEKALIGIEVDEKIKQFAALLPVEIEAAAKKAMGSMWSEETRKTLPVLHVNWDKTPILTLKENTAQIGKFNRTPTAVQQNIPAWTLFGMFFCCCASRRIVNQGKAERNACKAAYASHVYVHDSCR
ncbi:MAG TPA: ABC transporter permease [Syntrophorhabdaceae bacterium]|nr:ABC transporter permease [Syntrophorhabdaceae bacterium]